jgi:hypothetical protein
MVREVSGQFPLLKKTNYADWSAVMKVMLRARGLWAAVKEGTADEVEDQMAMEAILRGVPLEMAASLASKPTAKAAWDQLESSNLGSDRACMSSAQRVRRQYENIAFHDGGSLDDFALCLAKMVHELEILGDPEETRKVAAKYLRVVPKRFVPVTVSIESVLDTAYMSIEEITDRLRAVGGRGDEEADPPVGAGGKLLLTEEKWLAWMKDKQPGEDSSKSSVEKGGDKNRPCNQKKKNGGTGGAGGGGSDGQGDRNTCHNCGKKGHWAKE